MTAEDQTISHKDIVGAVQSLERKTLDSVAELRSDLRMNSEAVHQLTGSVEANWDMTRKQGAEIVRLNTLHEANSQLRAATAHADADAAAVRADTSDVRIPASALRLAATVMTAIVLLAGAIGALVGLPS